MKWKLYHENEQNIRSQSLIKYGPDYSSDSIAADVNASDSIASDSIASSTLFPLVVAKVVLFYQSSILDMFCTVGIAE